MSKSTPEKTGEMQDTRFQPGRSGNPAGKAKGTRNRTTRLAEAMLDGEAEELVRKAIEMAKGGDGAALRMCLERLVPPRKDVPVSFELPPIETLAQAKAASAAVLSAVASGDLTPGEGQSVMALLVSHKAIVEATDFEERLGALEAKQ